eukprot:5837041-Alexandrium_andersonii.AAC.1
MRGGRRGEPRSARGDASAPNTIRVARHGLERMRHNAVVPRSKKRDGQQAPRARHCVFCASEERL